MHVLRSVADCMISRDNEKDMKMLRDRHLMFSSYPRETSVDALRTVTCGTSVTFFRAPSLVRDPRIALVSCLLPPYKDANKVTPVEQAMRTSVSLS